MTSRPTTCGSISPRRFITEPHPSHHEKARQRLLPKATRWIEIQGGNHSQFGHYGHQLSDGNATISREAQQTAALSSLLEALANAEQ
jgi:hypothetical protein